MLECLLGGATGWIMIPFTLGSLVLWWIFLDREGMLESNKQWYWVLLYPIALPAGALGCLIGITLAEKQVYGNWWWSTNN